MAVAEARTVPGEGWTRAASVLYRLYQPALGGAEAVALWQTVRAHADGREDSRTHGFCLAGNKRLQRLLGVSGETLARFDGVLCVYRLLEVVRLPGTRGGSRLLRRAVEPLPREEMRAALASGALPRSLPDELATGWSKVRLEAIRAAIEHAAAALCAGLNQPPLAPVHAARMDTSTRPAGRLIRFSEERHPYPRRPDHAAAAVPSTANTVQLDLPEDGGTPPFERPPGGADPSRWGCFLADVRQILGRQQTPACLQVCTAAVDTDGALILAAPGGAFRKRLETDVELCRALKAAWGGGVQLQN